MLVRRWLIPLLLLPLGTLAQQKAADSVSTDRLVFYTFANDAFFRTDYYFTQGMTLNLVLPGLRKSPVNKILLPGPPASIRHYGVKLHYDGFTPLRIQDDTIRRGDRPYASYIYATLYRTATSPAAKRRLTSGLSFGFIGPAAGAKGFQTKVHELLDAPTPRGWDYQIRNDVVLGYEARVEQQILAVGRAVEVIGQGQASLGTLNTFAGGGLLVRVGKMTPYFQNLGLASRANRAGLAKFQLYATGLAEGRLVGYNATMQGGLFNRASPYTLPASDIKRVVGQGTVSLVAAYAGLSFRTSAVWITPEFRGSRHHAWVQFGLGVAF
ncbi:lipid A deacylase LpxR family protein [Hymenobacter cellulosivorans]|uniref:Lipid A deacylase LpxR family protein n=1 Tax=Hymenobacter cellulosivorans TaxID=2932249 RepID=A0ABY4FCM0_9BACT|nr:lipid A deacylase LpxR family protein [Hymenobacter cellulosivorans]UOQ54238.1 lipid A deacylase LpxR family protein [Hymenobacter cellulosivorans]